MPARRILVISPDRGFGQALAAALPEAAGTVEVHATLDPSGALGAPGAPGAPGPALYVVYLAGDQAVAPDELVQRLPGACPVIAVLPRANLAAAVALMQSSGRVAGMMVADGFDSHQFAAVVMRLVTDDVFGLDKVMVPGTQIHTRVVGDHEEKTRCMAEVSEFARQANVPRRLSEPIEQCIDEMLMNALYDAPVDAQGNHLFAGIASRERIRLRTGQSAALAYACDGKRFAISVRDAFGSLDRQTVLRHLHKGLHAEQQVDRKAGGAGLGLYLMVNASTAVYFHVLPGIATEALCVFDFEAPKLVLQQFGFLVQRDAAGRRATGPARRRLAGRFRRARALAVVGVAMVVLLGALGALLGARALGRVGRRDDRAQVMFTTIPKGAAIEVAGRTVGIAAEGTLSVGDLEIGRAYPVVARLDGYEAKQVIMEPKAGPNAVTLELRAIATVELDSEPTGAAVEIDGTAMGSTPLTLTSLAPGKTVAIVFKRTGYQVAAARLQVPAAGGRQHLVQPLEVSDEFVRVRFVSNPPGAEVIESGKPPGIDRTYTPAEVFVEATKLQRFTLTMPKHVPLVIEPFTPGRGEQNLEKGGDLVEGAALRIEATLAGKITVSGAPHCQEIALPADCILAPGRYTIECTVDDTGVDNAKLTHTVTMEGRDAVDKFELGFVEAGPGKLLLPGKVRKAVFEAGMHKVTVSGEAQSHVTTVSVTPGATVIAE